MSSALLTTLEARALANGLDLVGVVDAHRFDSGQRPEKRCSRLLPGCGTVVVLAYGGRGFWRAASSCGSGDPLRRHTENAVDELLQLVATAGLRVRAATPRCNTELSFCCLGEAAGFGTVSPVIHQLLHPDFGPWVSMRAALLIEGQPFGAIADASIAEKFQPCAGCPRPCIAACPAGVHDGVGESLHRICHGHRREGGCDGGCSVRRACPIGADLRCDSEEERHRHAEDLRVLSRRFGPWSSLFRFLRF